jgi:hypothetical protein
MGGIIHSSLLQHLRALKRDTSNIGVVFMGKKKHAAQEPGGNKISLTHTRTEGRAPMLGSEFTTKAATLQESRTTGDSAEIALG